MKTLGQHVRLDTNLPRLVLTFSTCLLFIVGTLCTAEPENLPTRCKVYLFCDDTGELFVNGRLILKATNWTKPFETDLDLKRGDIITVTVTDAQGGPGGAFSILVMRESKTFLDVKDFRYAVKTDPDWKETPSMSDFRRPDFFPLTTISMGNAKNLQKAWTTPKDRRFGTIYFKSVVR